jgi:hypothetical protein
MDKKALKILTDTHWSAAGWKRDFKTTPADFEYAKSKGLMFDDIFVDHKQIIEWLLSAFENTSRKHIVKCFLSSLSTRQLHLRSGLSSYAFARHFPRHDFLFNDPYYCNVCGIYKNEKQLGNLNVLNFERIRWGGVRLTSPLYTAFNLDIINKEETPEPNVEDVDILNNIIAAIKGCEPADRPNQLEKQLAKLLKSNTAERKTIIDILGVCGILETKQHKGFFDNYIPLNKRAGRPVNKTDWEYPVDWWTGQDGINKAALYFYFEDYLK